jgi:predicted nucleic acid-binding protein
VANSFFDSSAIVKRYVNEIGTLWVNNFASPAAGNRIHLARITGVEVISAIVRRGRGGSLSATVTAATAQRFRRELTHLYHIVAVTSWLIADAMDLAEKHGLRGYDAVQLAAALRLHARIKVPVLFVSADGALNNAASSEGLTVENPNNYP